MRLRLLVAALAVGAAALAGLLVGITVGDGEDVIEPIVVAAPAQAPGKASSGGSRESGSSARAHALVVDGRVREADAHRAAKAAQDRYGGRALTVDREGDGFEVEVQRADGRIVEVHLGPGFRVIGADPESEPG